MFSAPALKVIADCSDLSPGDLPSEESEVPETVADAWKNILRDVSSTRSDLGISADAVQNTGKLRKDNVKLSVNVVFPSSSDGGGDDSGESEVVANTSSGSGGKTTSVLKPSPSVGVSLESHMDSPTGNGGGENGSAALMIEEAWELLSKSYVYFKGQRVGTIAANDDPGSETLNYNQVAIPLTFIPLNLNISKRC